MSIHLTTDQGGYQLELTATFLGSDLLVTCTGGDRPHIGAVAVAHPQAGLDEVTANIICLSGHREDELARSAALKLSRALHCTVTVVAGMHWDVIDRAGIEQVLAGAEGLIDQLQTQIDKA